MNDTVPMQFGSLPISLQRESPASPHFDSWNPAPPAAGEEATMLSHATPSDDPATPVGQTAGWATITRSAYLNRSRQDEVHFSERKGLSHILLKPLFARYGQRLRSLTASLSGSGRNCPIQVDTIERTLLATLPNKELCMMAERVVVLELNVARLRGELEGDSPEARYAGYAARLQQPEAALKLLGEYPVLAQSIVEFLEQWLEFMTEFMLRLTADWADMRQAFSPRQDPGPLVELRGNQGDRHRGGRAVLVAVFGSGLHLVYKPRCVAVESHFQDLLQWVNGYLPALDLRALRILPRGDYGWVEYIHAEECAGPEQARHFYQRAGALMALFSVLDATDLHAENIIAGGEHPIPIDLECLFQPRTYALQNLDGTPLKEGDDFCSVLRCGLLPQLEALEADLPGSDVSGLCADPEQDVHCPSVALEQRGTDECRFVDKILVIKEPIQNRPKLNGRTIQPDDYSEEMVSGFSAVYRLVCQRQAEFISANGPLQAFAHDPIRLLPRNTQAYGELLEDSFHPDYLRAADARERMFVALEDEVKFHPWLAPLLSYERRDLLRGDIPLFTTTPSSRDLFGSDGELIEDYLERSSLSMVLRRVGLLSEEDLQRQVWTIRTTLRTFAMNKAEDKPARLRPLAAPSVADPTALIEAARAVACRLEQLAYRGDDFACWAGLYSSRGRWSVGLLEFPFYDANAGIAWFLAYLADATGEAQWRELARCAMTASRFVTKDLCEHQPTRMPIGAFYGWGGQLYSLAHVGHLWRDEECLKQAEQIVGILAPSIAADGQFNVSVGAAGCLAGLLSLHRVKPSQRTLQAALLCGERLLAGGQATAAGAGWILPNADGQSAPGFAHGTAGIACMLFRLFELTGDKRFQATASRALRLSLSPEGKAGQPRSGEMDETANQRHPHRIAAWSQGASGIGLGCLDSFSHSDPEIARAEINAAVRTTLATGFGVDHSLCQGDLGNLELLLQASRQFADEELSETTYRLTADVLADIQRRGWQCGVPLGAETPGLMNGLAGIGYGLLRLGAPERVPSVLLLEPPRVA